jgi:hypothetical protein
MTIIGSPERENSNNPKLHNYTSNSPASRQDSDLMSPQTFVDGAPSESRIAFSDTICKLDLTALLVTWDALSRLQ